MMKEMEKKQREDEREISNLKRTLNDIKLFYKNGFNRFFQDENVNRSNFRNSLDIRHEVSNKIDSEIYNKNYLTIGSKANNNRISKYNDYINKTEIKKGNNNQRRFRISMSKEDINSWIDFINNI